MKYTAARFAFVATLAIIVGVFVALIVYFTLVAALIFLLLATVVTIAIKLNGRKRARRSLESANVQRLTRPGASGNPSSPYDHDHR
jgi:hypothetical protein